MAKLVIVLEIEPNEGEGPTCSPEDVMGFDPNVVADEVSMVGIESRFWFMARDEMTDGAARLTARRVNAMWADDVETVEELVYDEEDE